MPVSHWVRPRTTVGCRRQSGRPKRLRRLILGASTLPLLGLAACPDSEPALSPSLSAADVVTCGAQYTRVTLTFDSLLHANGIPIVFDSALVCMTWTGSDYEYREQTLESSDWWGTEVPSETGLQYEAGTLTALDASGVPIGDPESINGSAMDFIAADGDTRIAVFDDPYYAIRAEGWCDMPDECGDDTSPDSGVTKEPKCDPEYMICDVYEGVSSSSLASARSSSIRSAGPNESSASSERSDNKAFGSHGVRRRGIRGLIAHGREINRSAHGYRRFEVNRGSDKVTYTVPPVTGLLARQEWVGPRGRGETRYFWQNVKGGYVLARSETQQVDSLPDGRVIPSRTIKIFSEVIIP